MAKRLDLVEKWLEAGELEANLALIQSMSMQGKTLAEIGNRFGIKERQLCYLKNKHSAVNAAIKNGRETVVSMSQTKLMELIKDGNITAIIYALKVYGGEFFNDRKHVQKTEISGIDGKPIEIKPNAVFYLPQKEELE